MVTEIVTGLNSATSTTLRRRLAIAVLVAAVVFLAILSYEAWRLSQTNDWSEIVRHLGPPVGWLVLALATAFFAVVADRSEKRHAVAVAAVGATASGTDMSAPRVVASQPWRGSALAGLSILAFSLSIVSSSQLGHLRSATEFELRKKENVAWCTQRECSPAEIASPCNGATPCAETIGPCTAALVAPSIAATGEQVPIDLSVYCAQAKPRQMPTATAKYGGTPVTVSFEGAKTTFQNERVWRWFVQFPNEGEQPVDVRMSFAGDPIAGPLVRLQIYKPTTIAGLQESTTAIGGLLTALVGLFGTIGALFKGLRGRSATVVMPVTNAPDVPPA
ncbi:MAG TPA: hypothetical protein VN224_12840 [Xanthomonadales bacterium]|nr:hypothetical protein [Xanthomonadales bacterium]